MDHPRPCGCKGRRTCLQCEKDFEIDRVDFYKEYQKLESFSFCPDCNKIYPGWNVTETIKEHAASNHNNVSGIDFPGFYIQNDFLTVEEERCLMEGIDCMPWDISQSGRRKQNFGPKVNFKKKKMKLGEFNGFPKFSNFIQDKFENVPLLKGYQTIEQCSLEYSPEKGASIDPHIDDCWIWGERIVTVNLLSDSVLGLTVYKSKDESNKRYNLDLVEPYKHKLISPYLEKHKLEFFANKVIRVPMPRRSLLVMYGAPRYQFEHSVLREDVTTRRVCLAYREFTPNYLKGGTEYELSEEIFNAAGNFFNHKIV